MNSWIQQVLSNEHATVTVLIAVFLMGIISVVTCGCNFAILVSSRVIPVQVLPQKNQKQYG
jgi:hypothetical protein